tara:strand:- start:882 stop:1670 length:789 start_codon:yes stop_codon:yes gene_type:complete
MELNDKVAIVTGAGSGIGRALAIAIGATGARSVICTDLDGNTAAETAAMIGASAAAAALDVSDEAAIAAMVAETESTLGAVDLFVSNAGYGRTGGLELPTQEWARMMQVHAWAHLAAARAVIPGMLAREGGYLLNTASAAGLLTQIDSGPYAVSKHAAVGFAEWLAVTYGDQGIGVSVLCPQAVRTNIGSDDPQQVAVGQASFDGVLEPETVADACIEAIREERFLVLPHPEVATYFQRKASDHDRWLRGMRRFRDRIAAGD